MYHVSRITCHVSYVTCHVSRVTCHMSRVTCQQQKSGQSGGASRSRVCYQRGLPRLVVIYVELIVLDVHGQSCNLVQLIPWF